VVLRNVTTSWPAISRWTDEKLKDSNGWGQFLMRTEGKIEGTAAPATIALKDFIGGIEDHKYVVSELPTAMYGDVTVPGCFSCGAFSSHITEIDIWISNGHTRSKFHKDSNNQLNCLIKGTKQWTVIDPTHIRKIPMMWEDDDPALKTAGESLLNPIALDLVRFPEVSEVPYNRSLLQPGDCIWIPGSTLHNVISTADASGRNMQISFLFSEPPSAGKNISPHYQAPGPFNPKAGQPCVKKPAPRNLTDVYVAWPYPGTGGTTYGFDCPKKFKLRMVAIMQHFYGERAVGQKEFSSLYSRMLHQDFPRLPTDKLFVFEGHEKYIPDALQIIRRRENYNLGDPADWEAKSIKRGGRRYYPGLREAAINLALKALQEWWQTGTKDGKLTAAQLTDLGVKEFQESWAFLYFPVQSIGHAFIGAMENDFVRNEDAQPDEARQVRAARSCRQHKDCEDVDAFCNSEGECASHDECHHDHDSIDSKCPKGAATQKDEM